MKKQLSLKCVIPVIIVHFMVLTVSAHAQEIQVQAKISWKELTKKLEDQGYRIHELETKYNGWEAEVTDRNDNRFELYLDSNGNIIHKKLDD